MTQADFNPISTIDDDIARIASGPVSDSALRRKVWQSIQASIKDKLGVERFGIWFKKTELLALHDSTLVVGVPNVIIKQYLEKQYKDSVFKIAKHLTGKEYEVRFDIASSLLQNSRRERKALAEAEDEVFSGGEETGTANASDPLHGADSELTEGISREVRHSFERLIVTESNHLPFLAAQEVACKKTSRIDFLLIYGPAGYGKTALMEAMARGAKNSGVAPAVIYEMAETWCNDYYHSIQNHSTRKFRSRYRSCHLLLLDGIQFFQGKRGAQDELLYTIKSLRAKGARAVLSCTCHPNELQEMHPEIQSLLQGAFWVELVLPPPGERLQIADRLAGMHNANLAPEVCRYLAENCASSMQQLNASVITVATYAALHGHASSDLKIAYKALSVSGRSSSKQLTLENICAKTAELLCVDIGSIKGASRSRSICRARHMTVMLARRLTDLSLSDIGRFLGGRSHSTMKHSYEKACELAESNPAFAEERERIIRELKI